MKSVKILDCTLRDGGYCNQWRFGVCEARQIVEGLVETNVDIIECGFLSQKVYYNENITKFSNVTQIARIIPTERCDKTYVAMLNYGEYNLADLPYCDGKSIEGIRVAFHKKDRFKALADCETIKRKGYKVFIQPMVSLSYTEQEFIELIQAANKFTPYAFYIVDSFGMMKAEELMRLFGIVKKYLQKEIIIGFHSHNNMQLAFSNAQHLCSNDGGRDLIIDSSVFGMGRGAGNLNTELFVGYLNAMYDKKYKLTPLLEIIDKILVKFHKKNYWGYSLPNYLSALHNVHPNYASFLDDKNTLTVKDMNNIFERMDSDKKLEFDKKYIEKLYSEYMETGETCWGNESVFKNAIKDKDILLIAPGKSSTDEKEKIVEYCRNNEVVTISVNHKYPYIETNYIFISNLRRYRNMDFCDLDKCIVTSNIPAPNVFLKLNYKELLNDIDSVMDNAGLMLIRLLIKLGCSKILLAGFDGYSHEETENYASSDLEMVAKNVILDEINKGMNIVLKEYSKDINIKFLTSKKYIRI